jgi:hypothetical protein
VIWDGEVGEPLRPPPFWTRITGEDFVPPRFEAWAYGSVMVLSSVARDKAVAAHHLMVMHRSRRRPPTDAELVLALTAFGMDRAQEADGRDPAARHFFQKL